MLINIKFNEIQINTFISGLEIIFPYENKWYRMDWINVPRQYKIMYVAWLKFQDIEIPEDLKQYEENIIDLSNLDIEINLDLAEEVSENYPLE